MQACLEIVADEPRVAPEYNLFRSIIIRNDAADHQEALRLAELAYSGLKGRGILDESMALMQLAVNHLDQGSLQKADEAVVRVRELIRRADGNYLNIEIQTIHLAAVISLSRLDYLAAEQICLEGLALGDQGSQMIGWVQALLAQIYYEWDEIERARSFTKEASLRAERSGMSDIIFQTIRAQARLASYDQDIVAMQAIESKLRGTFKEGRAHHMSELVNCYVVFYMMEVGELDAAVRWANGVSWSFDDEPTWQTYERYFILATVRLEESRALAAKGLAEPIVPLIEKLVAVTQETENQIAYLQTMVFQAVLLDWLDRPVAATKILNEALDMAEPGSIKRLFLDYGLPMRQLLARSVSHKPAYVTDLLHRLDIKLPTEVGISNASSFELTRRETDVLQAIAAGLSNKEIEQSLVISKNTVRTHIKNLYSKLGVESRTQAVAKASELGLI